MGCKSEIKFAIESDTHCKQSCYKNLIKDCIVLRGRIVKYYTVSMKAHCQYLRLLQLRFSIHAKPEHLIFLRLNAIVV